MKKIISDDFYKEIENTKIEIINHCLNFAKKDIDKVFAYASLNVKEGYLNVYFNAFFKSKDEVFLLEDIESSKELLNDFQSKGSDIVLEFRLALLDFDLSDISEIKIVYDNNEKSYDISFDFKAFDSITEKESFNLWFKEIGDC